MGFWLFMLVMNLLIPIAMIGLGRSFMKAPPAKINPVFGYRTSMSMKNMDTWAFAHRYCGKLWYVSGLCLLPMSILVMALSIGNTADVTGAVGGILCGLQLIPLIGAILPTERALRRTFDPDGRRR